MDAATTDLKIDAVDCPQTTKIFGETPNLERNRSAGIRRAQHERLAGRRRGARAPPE